MNSKTAIIDYGLGNLASVYAAFKKQCTEVQICTRPDEIGHATHLVLPGVGAFCEGMRNLYSRGWVSYLRANQAGHQVPLLGICLGMQLLASSGEEGGTAEGLGLIPGIVRPMKAGVKNCPVPHVGWNSLEIKRESRLLKDLPNGTDFYFVHGYVFRPEHMEDSVGESSHSELFSSVVQRATVFGVQFHPEKSSKAGALLIQNFLAI